MATQLQLRKGTTAEHSTFVGANGEVTVDTTKKTLVLHDGVTAGGNPLSILDASGKVPVAQLPESTLSDKGVVQLDDTLTSTSTSKALTAAQGKVLGDRDFGVGQTYVDVSSSRNPNTTYTNTTGRPISVFLKFSTSSSINVSVQLGGIEMLDVVSNGSEVYFFVVPNGMTYRVGFSGVYTQTWMELR